MGRWCNLDDVRCAVFIFLLNFKPSEPYLSHYLVDYVGLTRKQINGDVYPIYSYAQAVVAIMLVISKIFGASAPWVSDKHILIFGATCRMCTRILLLYANTVPLMQLMQVFYAVGSCSKMVFYGYCLRVSPSHPQRAVSISLVAALSADTSAALLGDVLLKFEFTYRTLMFISAGSVAAAVCVSFTLRSVDVRGDAASRLASTLSVKDTVTKVAAVYKTNYFGFLTLWSVCSTAAYNTIYGYESSFFKESNMKGAKSLNGTVIAIAIIGSAFSSLLPTLDCVINFVSPGASTKSISPRPLQCLLLLGTIGAISVLVFANIIHIGTLMPLFALYMMCYSFGNALVYGECHRAVYLANTHHARALAPPPSLALMHDSPPSGSSTPSHGTHPADENGIEGGAVASSLETQDHPLHDDDTGKGMSMREGTDACSTISSALISVVVVVNAWLETSVQAIVTAILFKWLEVKTVVAFHIIALAIIACMCMLCIGALTQWYVERGSKSGRTPSALEKTDAVDSERGGGAF
eukprot:GEMP01018297.1.p1 GENE.GEMP01018297.1~~GEMP01018297.1.p1  ORF type:complete len:537 (+),score=103.62 GEMP01018297.1:45-1613(+)